MCTEEIVRFMISVIATAVVTALLVIEPARRIGQEEVYKGTVVCETLMDSAIRCIGKNLVKER